MFRIHWQSADNVGNILGPGGIFIIKWLLVVEYYFVSQFIAFQGRDVSKMMCL